MDYIVFKLRNFENKYLSQQHQINLASQLPVDYSDTFVIIPYINILF